MVETFRQRLALRAVARAAQTRRPRPLSGEPRSRSVLVVFPPDAAGQRATWRFIGRLDLAAARIHPVVLGDAVHEVPDAHAGAVVRIGPERLDWRRLPCSAVRAETWARGVDVAVHLLPPLDPAAALLVGASPAAVRMGRYADGAEGFYDLMVAGAEDADAAADALTDLLRRLDPVVLPIR